jgi:hypothetical protein
VETPKKRYHMTVGLCFNAEHNSVPGASPLVADPWEGLQPRFIDFPDVLDRLAAVINAEFPDILTLYVCGGDLFSKCGLLQWESCVAIARPGFRLSGQPNPKRNVYICQDPQYSDFFTDVSSTEIRRLRHEKRLINDLTCLSVKQYLKSIGWLSPDL